MIAGFSAASASVTTKRIDDRRTAEKRDELASFKLIELHSVPCQPGAGLQDIESAKISQEVTATRKGSANRLASGWVRKPSSTEHCTPSMML